jgi:hypothetical protein
MKCSKCGDSLDEEHFSGGEAFNLILEPNTDTGEVDLKVFCAACMSGEFGVE